MFPPVTNKMQKPWTTHLNLVTLKNWMLKQLLKSIVLKYVIFKLFILSIYALGAETLYIPVTIGQKVLLEMSL